MKYLQFHWLGTTSDENTAATPCSSCGYPLGKRRCAAAKVKGGEIGMLICEDCGKEAERQGAALPQVKS